MKTDLTGSSISISAILQITGTAKNNYNIKKESEIIPMKKIQSIFIASIILLTTGCQTSLDSIPVLYKTGMKSILSTSEVATTETITTEATTETVTSESEESELASTSAPIDVSGYFVQGEPGADVSAIQATEAYYNQIPENIRNRFQSDGWRIIVCNSSLGPRWGYSTPILALTIYAEKCIYIDTQPSAPSAITHEIGHYVDEATDYASYTDEFAAIFATEQPTFCEYDHTHPNNVSTTAEYFAESFQQCIVDPTGMASVCPQTYNYIVTRMNLFTIICSNI